LGWGDPATGYQASVDYAGLADDWAGGVFGTETKGSVTERPLADGRAEVHVRLFTKDALTWVVDFTGLPEECVWQTCPLKFGGRWTAEGGLEGEPALGASFLEVKFINTAPGAPLPDLVQLVYFPEEDQETEFLAFRSSASGQLPNGTPGRAIVVQTGLFGLLKPPVTNENWDGFPAELIRVLPVGQ
jgi:hypothetical protein